MKTMNQKIYSKLMGHNNIELSDKSNITKKSSSTFGLFSGKFRNIVICKLKPASIGKRCKVH